MSIVKLRGLPWSVTKFDISRFLDGVNLLNGDDSVHLLTTCEGRLSGEAYVEVQTEDDVDVALKHDNALMGQRYIEIFRATPEQMKASLEMSEHSNSWNDPVVRLRGLPFSCTSEELARFFNGLQIASNGILMVIDFSGRFNGEAFVMFADMDNAYRALDLHKKMMGHRYIEIFRTNESEMQYYASNSNMIRFNKLFKEAVASNVNSNSSGQSSRRVAPYSMKPPNRQASTSQNFDSRMIPALFSNMQSMMSESNGRSSGSEGIPSLFDLNQSNQNDYGSDEEDSTIVKMRGLPYSVNINDIKDFFKPLTPRNVNLLFGNDGRLSGEAEVEFHNQQDAQEAIKYDKKYIGSRYIELFMLSKRPNSRINSNIPSLFDQVSFFSSQQQCLPNQNYNNRRQFNNRRGADTRF